MAGKLVLLSVGGTSLSSRDLVRRSCAWAAGQDDDDGTTLLIAEPTERAIVLGAFQRAVEIGVVGSEAGNEVLQRGSGGAAMRVGPGMIWMQLALPRVDALVAGCTPDKLINRYVRPLLRALTRTTNVPVSYFGRDWISAKHRPVALVAFAHDASTGRALFESIVGVTQSPLIMGVSGDDVADEPLRPSLLGKSPATLEEVASRTIDISAVVDAIVAAYRDVAATVQSVNVVPVRPGGEDEQDEERELEPPWAATREEAIGTIGAGRDVTKRMRVGGELMASRDAIARLEQVLAELGPNGATPEAVGRAVDESLTTGGAVTFGVRSLASIRDVIVEALAADPA